MRARFVGSRTKFRRKSRRLGEGKTLSLEKHEREREIEKTMEGGWTKGREEGRGGGLFHTHVKLGEFRYNGYLYARLESVALCKHGDRGGREGEGGEFSRRIHVGTDVTSAARLWFLNGQLGLPN